MHPRRLVKISALALPVVLVACSGATPSASPPPVPSAAASRGTELVADIDVGGRTLHLVCLGPVVAGVPTVVLESGLGGPYNAWSEILTALSPTHRVCAYDRAGLGASPPAPEAARTTADAVADLHAMLTAATVSGPYLLVGHSSGAGTVSLYA
ncbi:MAG: alpha/beta fold hydrolase, partial [Candidatus Limnocylindrales bacterium]